jgi:hypothetical protein
MPSSRWAELTIAGVEIRRPGGEWSRVEILDAEALKGELSGSVTRALDFSTHLQYSEREGRGVPFGARVAQMPASVLDAVVAAIEAKIRDGEPFAVTGSDESGVDDIDVLCFPDYEALGGSGRLYARGAQISGGFAREVTFRFITTGSNE